MEISFQVWYDSPPKQVQNQGVHQGSKDFHAHTIGEAETTCVHSIKEAEAHCSTAIRKAEALRASQACSIQQSMPRHSAS